MSTAAPEQDGKGLPDVVRHYQESHDRHDTSAALATFAPDARVVDDGREFRGSEEIRDWLSTAATEYSYTRTLLTAEAIDSDTDAMTWMVVNRLEGNFPGNVVDLRYRFVLADGLIAELVISLEQPSRRIVL